MNDERYTNPVYKTWMSQMAKEAAHGYESLSASERVFWCVYLLDLEVANGYFDQYFVNSSSEYADQVVAALHAIGAPEAAHLTQAVFEYVFPNGVVPTDQAERRELLEEAEERDSQYYQEIEEFSKQYLNDDGKIYACLAGYAREQDFVVE